MCFSAEASLAAGAVLLPAGCYATAVAWRRDRRYLPFAATPLLFGVQQVCEAGVWLGLERGAPGLVRSASLAFLFLAFAVWPFWVPASVAAIEHRGAKRRAFIATAGIGLAVGLGGYVAAAVHFDAWADVRVVHHSVRYDFSDMPANLWDASFAWQGLYLGIVIAPVLMSRDRGVRVFGAGLAAAAAVSHVLFHYAFASVWCFFAALASAHLGLVLYRLPSHPQPPDPGVFTAGWRPGPRPTATSASTPGRPGPGRG
jgi:hypothetical protein